MSTKIYDGLIYTDEFTTIQDFTKRIDSLRKKVHKVTSNLILKRIGIECAKIIDAKALKGRKSLKGSSSDVLQYVIDRITKLKEDECWNSDYNFDCKLYVYPIKHRVRGEMLTGNWNKILMFVETEHPEIRNVFLNARFISEYAYWDNSDEPEHVSKRDWLIRKRDWDKALPGIGVLNQQGFVFDFSKPIFNYTYIVKVSDVIPHIPALEGRIQSIAYSKSFDYIGRKLSREKGKGVHIGISEITEYMDNKGRRVLAHNINLVRSKLHEITEEHLSSIIN